MFADVLESHHTLLTDCESDFFGVESTHLGHFPLGKNNATLRRR